MAGSLAFFWSFAKACDELMSNSAIAKYSVNQTVTFLMAGVALLSLSANILGSIGEGRQGSFWEQVRFSGIRISGLLDLGVLNMLAVVVPRIFLALCWCVKQVSWVISTVLAAVGKLTDICRRALQHLLASALASLSSLVWFIWAHSALHFAASCAFLFLVYKMNKGDWVVCDESRSVRAAESVSALIGRATAFITSELPAVAAQAQSMSCAALQTLLQALTPVTSSAAGDLVCRWIPGAGAVGFLALDRRWCYDACDANSVALCAKSSRVRRLCLCVLSRRVIECAIGRAGIYIYIYIYI